MDGSTNYHFTYAKPGSDLAQGDLVCKTKPIRKLLAQVHSHYLKDDYTHLIVLTQSCDLVRRGGPCKSRYISLAAVRPLILVIEREIEKYQKDALSRRAGVCADRFRPSIESFVKKLLDNHETDFFYLEQDVAHGLPESSCAFLRLSIAVRSVDHYETLLNARSLSLAEAFQAKLGWMVGNMYSRVGTEDWVPNTKSQSDFDALVSELLDSATQWVGEDALKAARKSPPPEGSTREQLRDLINGIQIPTKKDKVIRAVMDVVKSQVQLDEKHTQDLRNLLISDPVLSPLLRQK